MNQEKIINVTAKTIGTISKVAGVITACGVKATKTASPYVVASAKIGWAAGKAAVVATVEGYKQGMAAVNAAKVEPVAEPVNELKTATPEECSWQECPYWTSDGSGCKGFLGNCPHYPEGYNAAAAKAVAAGEPVLFPVECPCEPCETCTGAACESDS